MQKQTLNYIIEVLMALFFLITVIAGVIGNVIHRLTGTIFIILLIIHILLHFKVIVYMTKNIFKGKMGKDE